MSDEQIKFLIVIGVGVNVLVTSLMILGFYFWFKRYVIVVSLLTMEYLFSQGVQIRFKNVSTGEVLNARVVELEQKVEGNDKN